MYVIVFKNLSLVNINQNIYVAEMVKETTRQNKAIQIE